MEPSINDNKTRINADRDIKISFFLGILTGILSPFIFKNIGLELEIWTIIAIILGLGLLFAIIYWVGNRFSKRWPSIIQFVKYGLTGGLNTLIDLGVLNLLIWITDIASGWHYSLFKFFSFLAGITNSYFWNKYWTFQLSDKPKPEEFLKFFVVGLVGLGINVSIASILVNVIGAPAGIGEKLWASVGAVMASVIVILWNFFGMKFLVFKR